MVDVCGSVFVVAENPLMAEVHTKHTATVIDLNLLHRHIHLVFPLDFHHSSPMAHSLAEQCTPLKREYDTCFNAWFEGYLEPAVAATPETRKRYSAEKAAEYERNCGKIWAQYRDCVQVIRFLRLLHPVVS